MPDYFATWLDAKSKPKQILLVDDSENDCQLIQQFTRDFHCQWTVAYSAEKAEQILNGPHEEFGLVFLDLNMPGQDGVSFYRKAKMIWPRSPIVILSAHITERAIGEIESMGYVPIVVQKPRCFHAQYFKDLFLVFDIPERPKV